MLTRAKIDDWIRQVEVTPVLAPILIRQITDRFLELDTENERLRGENLELNTGNKVKQLERKIAELEFQLDLLKRQATGGETPVNQQPNCLLAYNDRGQIIRLDIDQAKLVDSKPIARIGGAPDIQSHEFGLLAATTYDQLLVVFSSGRTSVLPVEQIPGLAIDSLEWAGAYQVELRSQEELVWILPITKLHLYDQCIQASRFGFARKIAIQYFKTFMANNNIGKGVKFNFDRILNLVLCNDTQLLVFVTRAGNCLATDAASLPVALDEVIHLKVNDYVISAGILSPEEMLVAVTQDGVAYSQGQAWLLPTKAGELKQRQFFPGKKESIPLAGVAIAGNDDWLLLLRQDGSLLSCKPGAISTRGTPLGDSRADRILAVAVLASSGLPAEGE